MIRTCISQIVFLLLFALAPGLSAEEGGWYHRDGTLAPNNGRDEKPQWLWRLTGGDAGS